MNLDAHQRLVLRHMGVPVYVLRVPGAPHTTESNSVVTTSSPDAVLRVDKQPKFVAAEQKAALETAAPAVLVPCTRAELRLPSAHLQRFSTSRLFQHLCLALGLPTAEVTIVENPVLSDTALHFCTPGKPPLKLGALALLNSNWRARRSAWQAIRGWRS